MMSQKWYVRKNRLPVVAGSPLSAAFVLSFAFGFPNSPSRAYAAEEGQAGYEGGYPGRTEDKAKELHEWSVANMQSHAKAMKAYLLGDAKRARLDLLAGPLFRYSEQSGKIHDATLWAWGTKGRPEAVVKVGFCEYGRTVYCFTSLSENRLEIELPGDRHWTPTKPGIEFRSFSNGPVVAKTERGRLRQMKVLASRFSVTIFDPRGGRQKEMRRLPRHVHRYSDSTSGLQDAAIFAFGTAGTNPKLLLAVELHGQDPSKLTWKYGLTRMTGGQLSVHLDQEEVWSVPYVKTPQTSDTWWTFAIVHYYHPNNPIDGGYPGPE